MAMSTHIGMTRCISMALELSVRGAVLSMTDCYIENLYCCGVGQNTSCFVCFTSYILKNVLAHVVEHSCEQSSSVYQSVISKPYANEY